MHSENTSGQGKLATVPAGIERWNWGAFLLNWIWGIGNNTLIALLMFVPFVNFVMPFILGAKGSAWAWKNKRWDSVEHFQSVQRQWTKWALIVYAATAVLFAGMFFAVSAMLKGSEPYKLAEIELTNSTEIQMAFGVPLATGAPSGSFQISGPDGRAHFEFGIEGPNGKGTAYVEARRRLGQWEIDRMIVDEERAGRRISVR